MSCLLRHHHLERNYLHSRAEFRHAGTCHRCMSVQTFAGLTGTLSCTNLERLKLFELGKKQCGWRPLPVL